MRHQAYIVRIFQEDQHFWGIIQDPATQWQESFHSIPELLEILAARISPSSHLCQDDQLDQEKSPSTAAKEDANEWP